MVKPHGRGQWLTGQRWRGQECVRGASGRGKEGTAVTEKRSPPSRRSSDKLLCLEQTEYFSHKCTLSVITLSRCWGKENGTSKAYASWGKSTPARQPKNSLALPRWQAAKNPPANTGGAGLIPEMGRFPGGGKGSPLSIPVWKIPWREEPGGLPSAGSPRVRHDRVTEHTHTHTHTHTQITSCGGESRGENSAVMGRRLPREGFVPFKRRPGPSPGRWHLSRELKEVVIDSCRCLQENVLGKRSKWKGRACSVLDIFDSLVKKEAPYVHVTHCYPYWYILASSLIFHWESH